MFELDLVKLTGTTKMCYWRDLLSLPYRHYKEYLMKIILVCFWSVNIKILCHWSNVIDFNLKQTRIGSQSVINSESFKRSNITVIDAKIWKRPSKDASRPSRDFWKISTLRVVFSKNALTRPDRFRKGIKNSLSSTI